MQKSSLSIVLSPSERTELLVAARSHTRRFAFVQRARLILLLADGVNLRQVSLQLVRLDHILEIPPIGA
jgi:hypothetical protein